MRIRLRFFAMLREKLGDSVERDARAGATVSAVWRAFVAEHPEVARVQVRFAVDEAYVEPGHRLADGDEVAVFPPVSGGAFAGAPRLA
jgi:molybdopterin converting factor subunit 1